MPPAPDNWQRGMGRRHSASHPQCIAQWCTGERCHTEAHRIACGCDHCGLRVRLHASINDPDVEPRVLQRGPQRNEGERDRVKSRDGVIEHDEWTAGAHTNPKYLTRMRSPDFFLVGAPKCGTTALYEMIGAHPEIFVSPIKEPDFFASDIRKAVFGGRVSAGSKDPASEEGGEVSDWSQYLDLFRGAAPSQRLGEGSVCYLASRVAAAAILERCPEARILMVLRDPADRLFSHYAAAIAARSTRATFPEWLSAAVASEKKDHAPVGPVVAGRYGANLQRYLAVFPASRIHIVWHEDFVADPAATLRRIFEFLGVDETRQVPVNIRRNETRARSGRLLRGAATLANLLTDGLADRINLSSKLPSTLRPSSADRALAIRLYEDDIRVLSGLTGRDLGHWTGAKG